LQRALSEAQAQLAEAIEQQTTTSEVLKVISRSTIDVQPIFDTIAANAVRLCEGMFSLVGRLEDDLIKPVAYHNIGPTALDELRHSYPMPVDRSTIAGRALVDRAVVHVPNIELDPDVPARGRELARRIGFHTVVAVPMLKEGNAIGAIVVARAAPAPFTERQVALLQAFADQAVIAIENVRLFKELRDRNRDLNEALEQQTATADILRVIASSPTDLQVVLDAVAESAARLCEATDVLIHRVDGQMLPIAASAGSFAATYPAARGFRSPAARWSVGR
jgi:GAF domain-containing protein